VNNASEHASSESDQDWADTSSSQAAEEAACHNLVPQHFGQAAAAAQLLEHSVPHSCRTSYGVETLTAQNIIMWVRSLMTFYLEAVEVQHSIRLRHQMHDVLVLELVELVAQH
jgi:hypothetical protein